MRRGATVPLAAIAAMIAACGASTGTPAPAGASASATVGAATPSPLAASCASVNPAAVGAVAIEPSTAILQIVNVHGTTLNQTPIDLRADEPIGVGCHGVYLYDHAGGDIQLLGLSGAPTTLAHVASTTAAPVDVPGAAESRDGRRWAYSVTSGSSATGPITSAMFVGTFGATPAVVATLSRANVVDNVYGGGYRVLRWDGAGVLLGTAPQNVGGAGPFIEDTYGLDSVVRLDPDSGALSTPLDCSGRGRFGDVAADGTTACASDGTVVIRRPDGSVRTMANAEAHVGAIAFVGGSSTVVWCASAGAGTTPLPGGDEWSDGLYSASLSGDQPSRHLLATAGGAQFESGYAFNRVIDDHTIAELTGTSSASSLTLVDVSTGHRTVLAAAVYIVGAL